MNGSLRRRVGLLALGTSAVKATQVVIAVLLVRLLSPEAWNEVALALSIYLAALTIGSFNLQQSLTFFLPLTPADQHRALVVRTARMMVGVGAGIGVLLFVVATCAGGLGSLSTGHCGLVGLAIACELPTVCAPAVFVSRDRLGLGAGWDLATTSGQILAVAVPAAVGAGVGGVLTGLVISSIARLGLFACLIHLLRGGPTADLPAGVLTRQLRYCLPLGLTMATGALTRSVDKWLVAGLDPHALGVYVIAAQELPVLAVLPYAGGAAVMVELVRRFNDGDMRRAHELWAGQAASMSAIVVPIAMFLVAAAPELFALLVPASYGAGVFAFRCFTLITLHRVTEYGIVLRAADRTATLVRASVVLLVGNAVLAVAGGLVWGADGVAVGCLAAFTGSWLYTVHLLSGVFGVPWRRTFPWTPWAAALGTALAATALALLAGRMMASAGYGNPVALLAVKLVVFGATVLAARQAPRRVRIPIGATT